MDDITHEMRLSQWTALLRECSNSGLSKKEWMRANHIKEKQFYYWQRRVRKEVFQELSSTSVPSYAYLLLNWLHLHQPISKTTRQLLHCALLTVPLKYITRFLQTY